MNNRLIKATQTARIHGLWEEPKLTRLLDGTVTRHELARAEKSVAEFTKLAAMTKRGAPDSSHAFDSVSVRYPYPRSYDVTVKGPHVFATFQNDHCIEDHKINRSHARRTALQGVAVATELAGAIKDQLVLQSGARTALEELKDTAEDAAIVAGRKAKQLQHDVQFVIAPGVKVARQTLRTAEQQIRTAAQTATRAVQRFIKR